MKFTEPRRRVLLIMADGKPRRGYEVGMEANLMDANRYRMLTTLLEAKWIIETTARHEGDPYYILTDAGRAMLETPQSTKRTKPLIACICL